MKTYRVWKWMLVMGKKSELDKIAQVAEGTHHVHRNRLTKIQQAAAVMKKDIDNKNMFGSPNPDTNEMQGLAGRIEGGSHVSD
jgi:hypothetical protein